MQKFLKRSVTSLFVVACVLSGAIYLTTYHPGAIENEEIFTLQPAPQLQPGQPLKILSWNVQFLAGRPGNHFFFAGGNDPWPSLKTVTKTALALAEIIEQEDPDIILLQELDEGAKRTYYEDQLQRLLDLLPGSYAAHTSSFYWLADFVPHGEIMGSVGMKLSIISKYRLEQAKRYTLPPITSDNILVRQYKPKRAIQGVHLPIEGGGNLHVLNTHLSAFAKGTDTMQRQITAVENIIKKIEVQGELFLLAGDFNLIPSDAAYRNLGTRSRGYYNEEGSEIAPLLEQYPSVPSLAETLGNNQKDWFTHIANNIDSPVPDKTIDYIFYSSELFLGEHYVRSSGTLEISDHLPVVANFTLPQPQRDLPQ